MKTGGMRLLVVFFTLMFLANNTAAAARACIVELAGPQHAAIQLVDADGYEHLCPVSDDAARCLSHCTQSYRNDEQKLFWADVPGFVFTPAPAPSILRAWSQPEPAISLIASAPLVVGPPLTILFRNLRI